MNYHLMTKDAVIIICVAILVLMAIEFRIQSDNQVLNVNELSVENELLRTELMDYEGTEELFIHYCVKCYCKDICQEAINEYKGE